MELILWWNVNGTWKDKTFQRIQESFDFCQMKEEFFLIFTTTMFFLEILEFFNL